MARVMIVDDAALARRIMRQTLASAGHEVVAEAPTGEIAVEIYPQSAPDLVTMDITMPGIDGIEAARRILGQHPHARIVMVTSLNRESTVRRSLEFGVAAYLIKPFRSASLLDVVNRVLAAAPAAQ